jgi:hypothetical protein
MIICAALLIGAYNDLVRDLGLDHIVVMLIMEAARREGVDDVRVKDGGCQCYHAVLKDWSRQITVKFKKDNDQVSPDKPKVNEELLRVLIDRVEKLEASACSTWGYGSSPPIGIGSGQYKAKNWQPIGNRLSSRRGISRNFNKC